MKRNFQVLLILLLLTASASAQQWRMNVSGGIDLAKGAISNVSNQPISYKTGLGAGIDVEYECSKLVSLQLGVNFSQQGLALASPDGSTVASINTNMLTIPLMLRMKATPHLHFLAGPQYGLMLSANTKTNGQPSQDVDSMLASGDYYAVIGGGYRFASGFFAEARYHVGLNNIAENLGADQRLNNRYWALRIGYSLSLGAARKK